MLELYWQSDSQVYGWCQNRRYDQHQQITSQQPSICSLNSWSIEGNSAGAQVTVYRRGVFNERTSVPVFIDQQSSGPPLRYNNLRTSGDHYQVVLAPGESTTSFSIVGIEDTRNTGPSELLLRLGEVPGYATTSSNPTRLVISDNETALADDVFSLSGPVMASPTLDQFWTIAALMNQMTKPALRWLTVYSPALAVLF